MIYKKIFKRLLDFIISLTVLIILSPVFFIVFIVLLFVNRGNPFFFQIRPGLNEQQFKVIKFKSMTDKKDKDGNLLPNHLRVTRFGKFIRKVSLDEIPQLINVLKGDMSLVGPRPLLFKYIPIYNDTQRRRHNVKPGITGWAQVNGRNTISWKQKFEYDVWYVDHVSFVLDLKIMWMTLIKVIQREGVDASDKETMPAFNGTN